MIGLRDSRVTRLGALLAGLALYLQLAFASWSTLVLTAATDPANAFGGHALCLADGGVLPQPAAPANTPTPPAHDHSSFCCLWHSLPAVAPMAAQAPQPVTYAAVIHAEAGGLTFIPGPHRGPANARAPPILT